MPGIKTKLTVRVIAKEGKFLGADVGGALVTVKNAQTGAILASGNTTGDSGNLEQIMQTKRFRSQPIPTDQASSFDCTFELNEPVLLEVTAYGPLGGLQSANRTTVTQWMVPGKDITGGDGLLIELRGLLLQVLSPPTHLNMPKPGTVPFAANVGMMCGCPIEKGGIWNSDDFEVGAYIMDSGRMIDTIKLSYTGTPSQFAGSWTVKKKGFYEAIVYAFQPSTGNTGMGRVTFFYEPQPSSPSKSAKK